MLNYAIVRNSNYFSSISVSSYREQYNLLWTSTVGTWHWLYLIMNRESLLSLGHEQRITVVIWSQLWSFGHRVCVSFSQVRWLLMAQVWFGPKQSPSWNGPVTYTDTAPATGTTLTSWYNKRGIIGEVIKYISNVSRSSLKFEAGLQTKIPFPSISVLYLVLHVHNHYDICFCPHG